MIHHITNQHDWLAQKGNAEFIPTEFYQEGFIHCCTPSQVTGVLERYFKGKTGLVLLYIDELLLKAELKYEASTNNEKFPHLYGGIARQAITKVVEL
jgi:uncharacterized protein (DUF952 family)